MQGLAFGFSNPLDALGEDCNLLQATGRNTGGGVVLAAVLHHKHCDSPANEPTRAVEDGLLEWPGCGEAEADLKLAYLLLGEEGAGLRWLRSAQQRFTSTGQATLLLTALRNAAHYLELAGQRHDADAVRARLHKLEGS